MTEAAQARAAALPLEAKIDKLQRLQGGDWKLTLTVADMPVEILTVPLGTRYQCAFVELADNEEPVSRKELTPGEGAKRHFEAMCSDMEFGNWVIDKLDPHRLLGESCPETTRDAAKALMKIDSANELLEHPDKWIALYEEFKYRDNLR